MKSVALSHGDAVTRNLLPQPVCQELKTQSPITDKKPLEQCSLEEMEQEHVARVLDATDWHKGRACEILGISRPRLRRMIRQYDLTPPASVNVDHEEDNGELNNSE